MSGDWKSDATVEEAQRLERLSATDPKAAAAGWEKLALQGSALSMLYLGIAYYDGEGVEKDLEKAEQWYRRASDAGVAPATHNLGLLYRKAGRQKDAFAEFTMAAEMGYAPSMKSVGVAFFLGQGVAKDRRKARDWWERAMAAGNLVAELNLARTMMFGVFGFRNIPRGLAMELKWIKHAWDEARRTYPQPSDRLR